MLVEQQCEVSASGEVEQNLSPCFAAACWEFEALSCGLQEQNTTTPSCVFISVTKLRLVCPRQLYVFNINVVYTLCESLGNINAVNAQPPSVG